MNKKNKSKDNLVEKLKSDKNQDCIYSGPDKGSIKFGKIVLKKLDSSPEAFEDDIQIDPLNVYATSGPLPI